VRAYSRNWRLMYVEYQILMIPMQNSAWVFIAPNSQSRQNRNVKNTNMSWMVSVKLKILLG
jgi:membrane-anchored protein YejM (alkaline phosphatase superfamily)